LQGEKVRQIQEEMEINPGSHTDEEFDKEDALYQELEKVADNEKAKIAKPDNSCIMFADWDRPNIYGLTPPQALFTLYLPTFISFSFVLVLQLSYIFYIQEVVSKLSRDGVEKYGALNCYGSSVLTRAGEEWDSQDPILLRIICLLTFITEICRVRVERTAPVCFITFCHLYTFSAADRTFLSLICVWIGTFGMC
jgi:hypothetical protein